MENNKDLLIKVFTHPACSGCGRAVELAWNLTQEYTSLKLVTIKLENKEGLRMAHDAKIKTIPTVIYYSGEEEKIRIVGTPKGSELKDSYLKLLEN
ncbi:MAG: hypothetical protein IIB39_00025 [Candidatus Marinimicrobia bacterium]|nr:hypothetical protein [Candidatus Neomarinimicrobiota bacterium]